MDNKKIGNILYNFMNGNYLCADDGNICLKMAYVEQYKVAYLLSNMLVNGEAEIVITDEKRKAEIEEFLGNI